MFGSYKENYNINGILYSAVVNFVSNTLYLYGRGMKLSMPLDEYTEFKGNMEGFIIHKIKESTM